MSVGHAPAGVLRYNDGIVAAFGRILGATWRWLVARPPSERRRISPPVPNPAVPVAPAPAPAPAGPQTSGDGFGSNAAARIIEAFDSTHPVRRREKLHGRKDKLNWLFDTVLFGHQHAIIHGARGSGKTSLAQVFGDYADQRGAVVIYTSCESGSSFSEILRPYIMSLPDSAVPLLDIAAFSQERQQWPEQFGPRAVVDLLTRLSPDCRIIMILDEFDRVENRETNEQIATLMKLLSDARAPVQILVVGIARTIDELIICHPSLRRHLVPIPIGRISRDDVEKLIETGAQRAGLTFTEESRNEIAHIACGSPYHVQLFCYVAAIEAFRREQNVVDLVFARAGIQRAFDVWAMLNPQDAEFFRNLASRDPAEVRAAAVAAREAAELDSLQADTPGATLLAPALCTDGSRRDRLYFRDGAAPQFLLALLDCLPTRAPVDA